MVQDFDPYLQWLGISKKEPRPINFYRLLGVDKFESDADVIAMNGDKQIEHLRKFSSGPQGELAEKLINTLIKAKLTLLKPDRKEVYDQQLRAATQPAAPPAPLQTARPLPTATIAPAVSDPAQWNIDAITAPALAAPTRMSPAGYASPVAPAEGMNFAPYGDSSVRSSAPKVGVAAKPSKSMVPWIILAVSVAACVGLTMVLANQNDEETPVAQKEPAAKDPSQKEPASKTGTKTKTIQTTPAAPVKTPAAIIPTKAVTPPVTDLEQPKPAAIPMTQPMAGETTDPAPEENSDVPVKLSKVSWPAITDPETPQIINLEKSGTRALKSYRYPGTTPRMATIVSRGHTASRWRVEQDELTMNSGASGYEFLLFGDPNWTDYTVEYEVYAEARNMVTPAGLLFRCADDTDLQLFQSSQGGAKSWLYNWTLNQEGFRALDDLAGEPIPFALDTYLNPKQWRKYSLTVAGNKIVGKRDSTTVFEQEAKLPPRGRVGLKFNAYADTKVRVRNIRVTAPDGKVLWDGLPDLPPSLDKAERSLWTKNDLNNWKSFPKPENPSGRWLVGAGQLYANSRNNPPLLLTQDTDFENFYLEIKFAKLQGECDVCLRFPSTPQQDDQRGLRLHIANVSQPNAANRDQPMVLNIALASDGMQLRINGVTKVQKTFANGGTSLKGRIGIDLTKPDSEVYIDEILVRRLPEKFRLFETRTGPLLEGGDNPAVAVNNPPQNPQANNPQPNNPLQNPAPNNNPGMPAAMNPDLQPRNSALGELAGKDEDVKKFLEELDKTRELCNTKIKKFEEDYAKAFDVEINRVRNTNSLNVNDRAELLQVLTQDKKDFETKKRFSLAHGMLPKNNVIGLILAERQRLERIYVLMIDRMLKEKRDEVVLVIKKAREEDPDLRPLKIFSVQYYHYPNSTPVLYEFMGDKTVNAEKMNNLNGTRTVVNNPQITWAIDGEKRLNFAGPLMYERMSIEQLHITLDGRKLVNGKSSTTSTIKTGVILVD